MFFRTFFVVALAALVVGLTLPNLWLPVSQVPPVIIDDNYNVVSVTQGLDDTSGLRVGDHIEARTLTLLQRLELWLGFMEPGGPLVLTVDRGGRMFSASIPNVSLKSSNVWYAILRRTTTTIFVLVATILLLRRPSTMLWGFFLYALGSTNAVAHVAYLVSPLFMGVVALALFCAYNVVVPLGLLLFATRFPVESPDGFRRLIQRSTPRLAALLSIPVGELVCVAAGVNVPRAVGVLALWVPPVLLTIGMIALFAGFFKLEPSQRQRLRWVVTGFCIYYAAVVYDQFSVTLPGGGWPESWTNAGWYSGLLNCTVIFIPITVAYAVLKHKVLDIRFVLGRGIVYAIITSIAVAVFAIIDWVATGILAQTRLAVAGDIVAAVGLGFWLNALHGRVDRFVDAVVFRARHLAEQRLVRVTAGLPHAEDVRSVGKLIVHEPVAAFNLYSGAFFKRSEEGSYRVVHFEGVTGTTDLRLDASDTLFVQLYGERGPVFLHQIEWTLPGIAADDSSPVVALPIFVRQHLAAVAFYGGHRTGEAIDPDEIQLLKSLCVGAAVALDHLDAESLRNEVADLRRQLSAYGRS